MRLPHPIPYQGSKRRLAPRILAVVEARRFETLYEPFAGSAAITLAASAARIASRYVISDSLRPLTDLWQRIIDEPEQLADHYEGLWRAQQGDPRAHFLRVREEFNGEHEAARLLYLLARCVKNSPRFNADGAFNQSADHRRRGMNPSKMRREIAGASYLLRDRCEVCCADWRNAVASATPNDLVYLDPPWEGTSVGVDKRYHEWLARETLIAGLQDLNERAVPFLLSYDGRHGDKTYGEALPDHLRAVRLELEAGRSSQATLNGQVRTTIESLYVSEQLGAGAGAREQLSLVDAV